MGHVGTMGCRNIGVMEQWDMSEQSDVGILGSWNNEELKKQCVPESR